MMLFVVSVHLCFVIEVPLQDGGTEPFLERAEIHGRAGTELNQGV